MHMHDANLQARACTFTIMPHACTHAHTWKHSIHPSEPVVNLTLRQARLHVHDHRTRQDMRNALHCTTWCCFLFGVLRNIILCLRQSQGSDTTWLQTNVVNTNGAAAKVKTFDRLGKKVRPGTFGKTKVGKREYPTSPSVKTHNICSDAIRD